MGRYGLMQLRLWTQQAKKTIENNVALDELIRLAFFWTANSSVLGFTGNQLTEDAWLLGSFPIYNLRKLMKNNMHIIDFLG